MLLRIQHYDFRVEELFEASCEKARAIFLQFDWPSELALAMEAQRRGFQTCAIGMELTDDSGCRLFLSPIDARHVCFNYVYHRFQSAFGLCQIDQEAESFVARYPIAQVARLIGLHFASEQGEILRTEAEDAAGGLTWPGDGSDGAPP